MKDGMQGFPSQKLGEVIELVSGQHIAAKDYNNESIGLPYLTGPSDFGVRNPKITRWTEHPKKCALKDDILITVKGSGVGSINVLDIDRVAISRQLMAIRAKNASGRYIELFLSLHQEHFRQAASGAAIPGLSREDVLNLAIPIPPMEEQKRIVAVLDQAFTALDHARAHAEANLADAGELYRTWLLQIFDPNLAACGPDEVKKIGDLCQIQSGAGFPIKEQGKTNGEYPFYKVSDMNLEGNEWRLKTANHYIDEAARKRLRAVVIPAGAITFPKVGGAINTNKKRIVETPGCVDNNVMCLIPVEDAILPADADAKKGFE